MKDRTTARLTLYAIVVCLIATCPSTAEAHLNSTGVGPIYDGLMHFVMSPEDLIPVVALALWTGLRGASYGRSLLFALPCAWLLGGLTGLAASATNGGAVLSSIWFIALGALLAGNINLSVRVAMILAVLLGLYHGYLNGTGMGVSGYATIALLGLVFAVFVLTALMAALVVKLRADWTRIAVRVIGSWIVASGLLLLGWALRKG